MATCESVQLVPGPRGSDGASGAAGTNGINAFTTLTVAFVQPAADANVAITVAQTGWMSVGQAIYIQNGGYYSVQSIGSSTTATVKNLGYTGNAVAGATIAVLSTISPSGVQGSAGSLTGDAGGDLAGTYPNPTIGLLKVTSAKMSVTGVTAATYGAANAIPVLDIDVAGRVTGASTVAFSSAPTGPAGGDLTGTYPNPTLLTVTVAKGGTNIPSYTVGDMLYASGVTTLAKLADVATGNVLLSGGVATAPAYGKVTLTGHVSGTLPEANGGTGNAAYTVGDLLYASGITTLSKLADVATGNVLKSGGVGVAPAYGKVDLTADTTGTIPATGVAPGTANQMLATNVGATATEWRTLAGTTNQVNVTFGAGSVTLATPQDIDTSAAVRFLTCQLGLTFPSTTSYYSISSTRVLLCPTNGSVGVGGSALNLTLSGTNNTAVGSTSGNNLTSGGLNTFVGQNSGGGVTTASQNVAVGASALSANSMTGGDNTAVGYRTLVNLVSGTDNTAIGHQSLFNATGSNNVSVGSESGQGVTSGSDNTCIGFNADVDAGASSKRIAIGANVTATADNTCFVGGTGSDAVYTNVNVGQATTERAWIGGTIEVNTTQVGNVGVGEDDLMTYSVPANSLFTNGDRIFVRASGEFAANANNKTVKFYFGSTAVFSTTALALNGGDWCLYAEIIRTGATTQKCHVHWASSNTLLISSAGYGAAAETLSGAVTLKLTGEGTDNNDITQETMSVEWHPRNS